MLSPLASAHASAVADAMAAGHFGPSALKRRADEVRQHYDRLSATRGDYVAKNHYYYEQIYRLLRFRNGRSRGACPTSSTKWCGSRRS